MSAIAPPTAKDRLLTALLKLLPQHLLSAGMYRLARCKIRWLKNAIIRFVVRRYRVDMSEAIETDPFRYDSFNAFFTRALRPEARPMARQHVVSPADGNVSQSGPIDLDRLIQAKGHDYGLLALLAGDRNRAAQFEHGSFATIYLSPRDYHRVHMPLAGTLTGMTFVPGDLFSVSEATTQLVPGLFARNERVISYFETAVGPMAVILVGAIFVGTMDTVWAGEVRGPKGQPSKRVYEERMRRSFDVGEEMGRFNMGSTVILLFPRNAVELAALQPGQPVRVGEAIGRPLIRA